MPWEIIVYETSRGDKPIEDFIQALQPATIAKVAHVIDLLETHGPFLGMHHSKQLDQNIYEFRIKSKETVRIFYTFKHKQIYLVHAFKKKTQKTPRKELKLADKRILELTNI